jgi:hypothetical protein
MSELALWKAEDADEGAQRIAGRPAQAFWRRLRSSFRGVLLEPHRRAGDGRVSWSWTGPTDPAVPGSVELADLRQRLAAGLINLAAELERDEETGGGEAVALHEGMQSLIGGLNAAPDAELATFAVRTEMDWMIRSWGIVRPSAARRADEGENEPPEEPVTAPSSMVPEPLPALPVVALPQKKSARRRRLVSWLVGGAVALGLLVLAFWSLRDKPPKRPVAEAGQKSVPVSPPTASTAPAGGVSSATPHLEQESFPTAAAGPVVSRIFPTQATASRLGGAPRKLEIPGKVVPVPMAYSGPIASTPADEPRPPEFEADPNQGGMPDPARAFAGRGDQPPAGNNAPRQGGLTEAISDLAGAAGAAQDALASTSGDRSVKPGEVTDRVGAKVRQDWPVSESFVDFATAPPSSGAGSPDAPVAAAPGVSVTAAEPKPVAAVPVKTNVGERDGAATLKPTAKAPAEAVRTRRVWSCRLGEWRLARTRDVALTTVPSEVAAAGDAQEALATARRQAWEQVRAALPLSLRQPITRAGWVLVFTKATTAGGAPVWRMEPDGERRVQALAGTNRAELGWAEPLATGLVARLLGPDGEEWACVRVAKGGRTIAVRAGAEIAEDAPWFEVRGGALDAPVRPAVEGLWRSLSAGWLDTRWQRDHAGEALRVYCFGADPRAALPVEGVVALEHLPSGWALARAVQLDPSP